MPTLKYIILGSILLDITCQHQLVSIFRWAAFLRHMFIGTFSTLLGANDILMFMGY